MKMRRALLCLVILLPLSAAAQLITSIFSPKVAAQKTVVSLALGNTFTNGIDAARATMFLLDRDGKVLAQSTRWVIGGEKDRPALLPGKEATYNFVFTVDKPFASTKLTFNRIVLEGGKTVDPVKNVQIVEAGK